MKLDYTQVLTKFNGDSFTDEKEQPLTLGAALITACSRPAVGDNELGPMGKYEIGKTGHLISKGFDIDADQRKLLRDRIESVFLFPDLIFVVMNILEEKDNDSAAQEKTPAPAPRPGNSRPRKSR